MLITKIIVIAIAGALGAAMANRGVAVYHDGLRPIMPELIEGRMKRIELASISFGLSFGLVIGFGIPFSLTSAILLVHSLWLGTDIIGTWFPGSFAKDWKSDRRSLLGLAGSFIVGGLYGALLVLGLEAVVKLFERLPVNFFNSLGTLGDPIVFAFAVFPAIAVAYQYGIKNGIIALVITLLGRQVAVALGQSKPDGYALAIGIIVLIIYAIREKTTTESGEGTAALFTDRANRIRSYLPIIAVMGAVYGLACHLAIMMEGPQSITALASGDRTAATGITVARALSFIPLKGMTSLATGVFATDGFGFVATAGLLSPNPIVAVIAGAIVMSLEALSLVVVARFLDRFPGIRRAADNIRTAMTQLLEVATLVGGMMAANAMAPGLGFFAVAGIYLLNETAGTPIVRMAVGPVGAILVGIVINILALLGLFTPPA
jgi:hypothetical protein